LHVEKAVTVAGYHQQPSFGRNTDAILQRLWRIAPGMGGNVVLSMQLLWLCGRHDPLPLLVGPPPGCADAVLSL
jgi:hypothetical protein